MDAARRCLGEHRPTILDHERDVALEGRVAVRDDPHEPTAGGPVGLEGGGHRVFDARAERDREVPRGCRAWAVAGRRVPVAGRGRWQPSPTAPKGDQDAAGSRFGRGPPSERLRHRPLSSLFTLPPPGGRHADARGDRTRLRPAGRSARAERGYRLRRGRGLGHLRGPRPVGGQPAPGGRRCCGISVRARTGRRGPCCSLPCSGESCCGRGIEAPLRRPGRGSVSVAGRSRWRWRRLGAGRPSAGSRSGWRIRTEPTAARRQGSRTSGGRAGCCTGAHRRSRSVSWPLS